MHCFSGGSSTCKGVPRQLSSSLSEHLIGLSASCQLIVIWTSSPCSLSKTPTTTAQLQQPLSKFTKTASVQHHRLSQAFLKATTSDICRHFHMRCSILLAGSVLPELHKSFMETLNFHPEKGAVFSKLDS